MKPVVLTIAIGMFVVAFVSFPAVNAQIRDCDYPGENFVAVCKPVRYYILFCNVPNSAHKFS